MGTEALFDSVLESRYKALWDDIICLTAKHTSSYHENIEEVQADSLDVDKQLTLLGYGYLSL